MKTTVQRIALPDNRRILAISDVHGHASGLRSVLEKAGFCERDVLIIVGDLVEKGPESLAALRFVMELTRRYTVYPLLGNVDLWRLERLLSSDTALQQELARYSLKAKKWWGTSFLEELCEEIGETVSEEMDTQAVFARIRKQFAAELAFLAGLPTVLETQNMIFVHGGIPHEQLHLLEGGDAYPLLKCDAFYRQGLQFSKYVAVGHWPVALYSSGFPCANPLIDRERRILCLDGGCGMKDDGQLNLLSIPDWRSEDFQWYTWDDLPVITALEDQSASQDSGYIRWGDHQIQLLEQRGDAARILHHGREMEVPADYVTQKEGQYYCSDITDYRLPVSAGDRLALVLEWPGHGCYVKKNGASGWYRGAYEKEAGRMEAEA